jgi:hypothetical protein
LLLEYALSGHYPHYPDIEQSTAYRQPKRLLAINSLSVSSQASQYPTIPAPRRGFIRVRDIFTDGSNGRFAILFMPT